MHFLDSFYGLEKSIDQGSAGLLETFEMLSDEYRHLLAAPLICSQARPSLKDRLLFAGLTALGMTFAPAIAATTGGPVGWAIAIVVSLFLGLSLTLVSSGCLGTRQLDHDPAPRMALLLGVGIAFVENLRPVLAGIRMGDGYGWQAGLWMAAQLGTVFCIYRFAPSVRGVTTVFILRLLK